MTPGGLPILTYHAIEDSDSPLATGLARFDQTIRRLIAAGWRGVNLAEWAEAGRPEVSGGFAVAFDDGLRSIGPALDLLASLDVPATIFVVTDRVGLDSSWPGQPDRSRGASLLDWSELAEFAGQGFVIGAHSRTHVRLDRLDDPTLNDEIVGSGDAIEARLGRPCRLFASPYGCTSRAAREVIASRYDAGFGTRMGLASGRDRRESSPRFEAYYLRSDAVLDRLVTGRLGPWLALRRTLRAARGVAMGRLPVPA